MLIETSFVDPPEYRVLTKEREATANGKPHFAAVDEGEIVF